METQYIHCEVGTPLFNIIKIISMLKVLKCCLDHCGYFINQFICAMLTLRVVCWPKMGFPRNALVNIHICYVLNRLPVRSRSFLLILKMGNEMLVSIVTTDLSIYLSIYLSVCLSVHVWLYSPLLDLGRFFRFLIHTQRATQTQNKGTQTSMPRVRFEPTIPASERPKTVHELDRAPLWSALQQITWFNFRNAWYIKCTWEEGGGGGGMMYHLVA
jgi:hypothetical protein